MPEGKCKKCGKKYAGWALINPAYHACDCGGEIEITYPPSILKSPPDNLGGSDGS
jgi:hypothetical protein